MIMTDVIIVGAGTAGLTAAIYARRAGRSVLLFESSAYGGQIINTPDIENYPGLAHVSGFDFATALYQQAADLGAELKYERVLSVKSLPDRKIVHTAEGNYEARAVILATGAKNRPLGLDREKELIGRGVSYCATCDGMFFRGRDVVVAGGGNTALEDAAFLANYCRRVYLVHRRDEFRGSKETAKKLAAMDNVEFVMNSRVTKILGDEKVEGVEVTDKDTGAVRAIAAAALFVAIGQMPDNEAFSDLVELSDGGYIEAGEDCRTKTAGIYTAGDCRTKTVRQLTTAAADGAVAALAASQEM
jgi:thioredoxin reductase (NADPH)